MKIFGAKDNVHPGHISTGFSIDKTTDNEGFDVLADDYDERLLNFKLFFDAPVVMDATGTKVQKSGNMVGDGIWADQEVPVNYPPALNQAHPDFIWQPESAYVDFSRGYGNPYIGVNEIQDIANASAGASHPAPPPVAATPAPQPPPVPQPAPRVDPPPGAPGVAAVKYEIETERPNIYDGDNPLIDATTLARILRQGKLGLDVD